MAICPTRDWNWKLARCFSRSIYSHGSSETLLRLQPCSANQVKYSQMHGWNLRILMMGLGVPPQCVLLDFFSHGI